MVGFEIVNALATGKPSALYGNLGMFLSLKEEGDKFNFFDLEFIKIKFGKEEVPRLYFNSGSFTIMIEFHSYSEIKGQEKVPSFKLFVEKSIEDITISCNEIFSIVDNWNAKELFLITLKRMMMDLCEEEVNNILF